MKDERVTTITPGVYQEHKEGLGLMFCLFQQFARSLSSNPEYSGPSRYCT